jgi:uncharacterized membrane protein
MDTPLELIISVFDGPDQAGAALDQIKRVTTDGQFNLKDAAVLVKDANGHVRMDDEQDVSAGQGALFGAITGALIGLLGGPAGAVAGAVAGAATGGVTASLLDMGFSDEQLAELKDSMPPNSSALVALIEHAWVDKLAAQLRASNGRMFQQTLDPQVGSQYR